jgi:hypothetical protein
LRARRAGKKEEKLSTFFPRHIILFGPGKFSKSLNNVKGKFAKKALDFSVLMR